MNPANTIKDLVNEIESFRKKMEKTKKYNKEKFNRIAKRYIDENVKNLTLNEFINHLATAKDREYSDQEIGILSDDGTCYNRVVSISQVEIKDGFKDKKSMILLIPGTLECIKKLIGEGENV
jgi:hypothetical protein